MVRGLPNCEQAFFASRRIEIRGGIVPTNTKGPEAVVPDAAGRRLSNQVARAYRGTYGARAGLRAIVRATSAQMLRRGSSPEGVARALSDFAVNCPVVIALGATRRDALDARALPALISEYSSEVALEIEHQRARLASQVRETASARSSG
jgi:hypothetical protein